MYTKSLLTRASYDEARCRSIVTKLVYGYTHHPFPIDMDEARLIGLEVEPMRPALSVPALEMVTRCTGLRLDIAVGAWAAAPAGQTGQTGQAGQAAGTAEGREKAAAGPAAADAADAADAAGRIRDGHKTRKADDGVLVSDQKQAMVIVNPGSSCRPAAPP